MNDKIKRLLAGIIDHCIICFLATAVIGVVTLGEFNVTPFTTIVYLILYILLLFFRDFALKNASIGKRIFKLKVAKTDGTNLMIVDAIKRSIPIVFLLPVEILLIVIDNRRIGDIWAKTSIIYCGTSPGSASHN